jgi:hypothetical protein
MPIPTEAPSWASRIALDFTARQARHANARSASTSSGAALAGRQGPGGRVVAGRVHVVDALHQQPAGDAAELHVVGAGVDGAAQDPDVLLGLQRLDRAVLVAGRHDHLGEDLGDLLGQLQGDRAG